MNRQLVVLLYRGIIAALVFSLCGGTTTAQYRGVEKAAAGKQPAAASSAELDRMIAAGRSQRELAQHVFDTYGCTECHTIGSEGKLGFTVKGQEKAQGFEGCISTLKAMSVIAKVPENERSATQRRRAERFEAFGCAACHKITFGKMGLTDIGAKLANLHLGCVDVQKQLALTPASQQ